MCGLVGVAGNVTVPMEKAFKRMLELDTIRGPHSTGVCFVPSYGEPSVIKKAGTPWELYQYKRWEDLIRPVNKALIGHNRWATVGAINAQNAHPFEHGHIIGAHNGTLRNQRLLLDSSDFEVDSDNLYYHISEKGLDDALMHTNGAFALSWYDKKEKSLNFIRNDERPLHYLITADGKGILWASEVFMLQQAIVHAGIKTKDTIYQFGVHMHYKIDLSGKDDIISLDGKLEGVAKKVYTPPVVVYQSKGHSTPPKKQGHVYQGTAKRVVGDIIFKTVGVGNTNVGNSYIELLGEDGKKYRAFPLKDSPQYRNLSVVGSFWSGKPGVFVEYGEDKYYTVVSACLRGVAKKDVPKKFGGGSTEQAFGSESPELLPVYGKALVPLDVWKERTEAGCCWCASPAEKKHAHSYTFVDSRTYYCQDCEDLCKHYEHMH